MNVTIVCPHFAPDVAPTGVIITRIVSELAGRGHRVQVVTSLPWYRNHAVESGWEGKAIRRDDVEWGTVSRVHPFPSDKHSLCRRALGFVGFTALATAAAMRVSKDTDVVLAMSPPLTLGVSGRVVARLRGVPLVFNVQDVFPDVAVEVGAIRSPILISVARALERHVYRTADSVTVLSADLADNLTQKIARRPGRRGLGKIRIIPNFVDLVRIAPQPIENPYRREHGLSDRVVVMYAGNVGYSQSLDLFLDAARSLSDHPEVVFVINGGGSALEGLRRDAADLTNVRFVGFQPAERLAEVLAAADVHIVPLKAGLARSSVPSKTYSVLAAGRAIVASVDPGTEVDRMVRQSGAGRSVAPGDRAGFVQSIRELTADASLRERMGAAGRKWAEAWVSPAAIAESYERLFLELSGG